MPYAIVYFPMGNKSFPSQRKKKKSVILSGKVLQFEKKNLLEKGIPYRNPCSVRTPNVPPPKKLIK